MPSSTPQEIQFARLVYAIRNYLVRYSFELLLVFLILYTCISRGLKVGMTIHDPEVPTMDGGVLSLSAIIPVSLTDVFTVSKQYAEAEIKENYSQGALEHPIPAANVSQLAKTVAYTDANPTAAIDTKVTMEAGVDHFNSVAESDDPAPHISNLTLILSPDYAERKQLPAAIVRAKKQRVKRYLDLYAGVAQLEMREYGIPASITLAQALLESNAGDSKLARESNNHFGIKCRSKCLGCTCRNYGDDTRYDMFRVFDGVAASFREHSLLLTSKRYARLSNYGTDYKRWAHGLKACGYATDKRYAQKLIKIIEELDLDEYDETRAA